MEANEAKSGLMAGAQRPPAGANLRDLRDRAESVCDGIKEMRQRLTGRIVRLEQLCDELGIDQLPHNVGHGEPEADIAECPHPPIPAIGWQLQRGREELADLEKTIGYLDTVIERIEQGS